MLETQAKQMVDEFAQNIQYQGISIDQYYQMTGTNEETFMEQVTPQAIQRIKTRLILEEIVKVEDIQIADEEFNKRLEELAENYKMEVDKLTELMGEAEQNQMKQDIAVQKAIDLIEETSIEVEVVEEVEAEENKDIDNE